MTHRIFTVCLIIVLFTTVSLDAQSYQDEITAWHHKREQSLAAENGWLNVSGLFWLEEGKNSFGTAPNVQVKFPAGTIAPEAGYFELEAGTVTQYAAKGTLITVNGTAAEKAVVFNKENTSAPVSAAGNLRWTIIKRGEKFGVRLRNLESPAVKNFKGIAAFNTDSSWVVNAVLQSPPVKQTIAITNVLGQTNQQPSAGKLYFSINNKKYTLDALEEGDELFIIFADATSGETTYPSGRFLYAKKTTDGGTTVLDFNKAYNPPCAFTAFATCPLPPKQNVLPVAITAGEKNYVHE